MLKRQRVNSPKSFAIHTLWGKAYQVDQVLTRHLIEGERHHKQLLTSYALYLNLPFLSWMFSQLIVPFSWLLQNLQLLNQLVPHF